MKVDVTVCYTFFMKSYFATFIPGFSQVIEELLKKDFPDIEIIRFFSSSLLFRTESDPKNTADRPYLSNVFLALHSSDIDPAKQNGSVAKELHAGIDPQLLSSLRSIFPNTNSFRMMVQQGNKLVHIPKDFSRKILSAITKQTKLIHNPLKSDIEFWFLIRNERFAVCGVKISKNDTSDDLQKGQLQPELAYLLNYLSEPKATDIYLDPFAGHGTLALDRLRIGPFTQIYTSDTDKILLQKLKKMADRRIIIKESDGLNLTYLSDHSITTIVTDPPWGIYQMEDIDYTDFYTHMLGEMIRVLKEKGILVILTGKPEEFDEAVKTYKNTFSIVKKIKTLVNGKKATVYKMLVA